MVLLYFTRLYILLAKYFMFYLVLILNFAVKYLIPIDGYVERWLRHIFLINIFSDNANFMLIYYKAIISHTPYLIQLLFQNAAILNSLVWTARELNLMCFWIWFCYLVKFLVMQKQLGFAVISWKNKCVGNLSQAYGPNQSSSCNSGIKRAVIPRD